MVQCLVLQELLERVVHRVQAELVHRELLEKAVHLELLDLMELILVHRELLEKVVHRELLEKVVRLVHQELLAHQELLD